MPDLKTLLQGYLTDRNLSLRQLSICWGISRHMIKGWMDGREPDDSQKRFLNLHFLGLYEVGLGPIRERMINLESARIVFKINSLINIAGLSIPELARAIGCKTATVRDWVKGINYPHPKIHGELNRQLIKLAIKISKKSGDSQGVAEAETPANPNIALPALSRQTAIDAQRLTQELKLLLRLIHIKLADLQSLSPKARDLFRQSINIEDVAALGSMLKSMRNEHAYQTWRMFALYKIGDFEKTTKIEMWEGIPLSSR
jgi:hypothetical protein